MYNSNMGKSGFVDLQVNGYAGINFSDPGLTLAQVQEVARLLALRGTLAFCPTVITTSREAYRRVLPVLSQAIRQDPCLLGIHLEGPFLSPDEGAIGVHPRQFACRPSPALLDELYTLAEGKIALLTLAPELPDAVELIRHARGLGIVVSIGHTLAASAEVHAAVDAGARLSTHLGNGCPNTLHRHHNPIFAQLAAPELTAMLITDGHHLPPDVIRVIAAVKGAQRLIVTSDVAPAAGCPPGEYTFFGARVLLEPSGRLRNLQADTLAGSSSTLLDCMNFLASLDIFTPAELWRVGRDNPLAVLNKTVEDLPEPGRVRYHQGRFDLI
jgi:N-acetylglucosamine-6-phosphate deacetylase